MQLSLPADVRSRLQAWASRLPRSGAIALDLIPADPEDAGAIRAAQIGAIVRLSPFVMGASCVNAAITLATLADLHRLRPAYVIWALLLLAVTWRFLLAWARRREAKAVASRRAIRRVIQNAALFGLLWGVVPLATFPGAPLQVQLFVASLAAGMMSAGAFVLAAVPLAAMSYVAIVGGGALIVLLQQSSAVYLALIALLASYTVVIVVGVNWSAALLVNTLLAEAQLRREIAAREEAQALSAHAERMTALGQLSGGIAHDFNNILQVVSGGAARIERAPQDPENVARQLKRINDAVDRGSAISRRLLAFARRDALSAEPIDAALLLTDLGELLAHTIGPPIKVHVDVAMTKGSVMADRRQLETVILNLATNARDAMADGGDLTVSATSTVRETDSEFPRLRAGRYVRICVADTGVGMPPDVLARVAEPFFTTKPKGMGTGLGVSMAKGFAEQSGGAFAITSEPGQGTTATLWLPQAELAAAAPGEPSARAAASLGAGLRVLVVDDDALVLDALMSGLEDAGFAVLGANNASTALALIEHEAAIDAIVTDFSMPGMNGIDLIRNARLRKPGLPAVLVTGHVGDVAESVDLQHAEEFLVLQKPVSPARLVARFAELLAARAVERPG
jgi:signal transduction histidine kinase/ActR/RegA family two-component response regulator